MALPALSSPRSPPIASACQRCESIDDPRLQIFRLIAQPAALLRAGLFVAEGRFVVERLLAGDRFTTHSVLASTTAHAALARDVLERTSAPVYVVEQPLMNQLAGFNMHRGCVALAHRPGRQTLAACNLASLARVLVLEGVNNPDNVGGLFRSAAAFGVDAVVLGPSCGDPLYRKAIRTSMAATLQVPFVDAGAWPGALHELRRHGLGVLALTPAADARPLDTIRREDIARCALIVGTEGEGLSAGAIDAANDAVRIDMRGGVDSLNVVVAASIAMHELF